MGLRPYVVRDVYLSDSGVVRLHLSDWQTYWGSKGATWGGKEEHRDPFIGHRGRRANGREGENRWRRAVPRRHGGLTVFGAATTVHGRLCSLGHSEDFALM